VKLKGQTTPFDRHGELVHEQDALPEKPIFVNEVLRPAFGFLSALTLFLHVLPRRGNEPGPIVEKGNCPHDCHNKKYDHRVP
jgi:hypothetical protein